MLSHDSHQWLFEGNMRKFCGFSVQLHLTQATLVFLAGSGMAGLGSQALSTITAHSTHRQTMHMCEDYSLLGCYAVWSGTKVTNFFLMNLLSPFLGVDFSETLVTFYLAA